MLSLDEFISKKLNKSIYSTESGRDREHKGVHERDRHRECEESAEEYDDAADESKQNPSRDSHLLLTVPLNSSLFHCYDGTPPRRHHRLHQERVRVPEGGALRE
eukprot:TRINITY_DN8472_c0_g1_i1.p1 TRINITY_DN8472_c0_g1~~TRINITY_DN8472_c0_g1_i1.p1  ORF type:complete len:104 (-),score=10.12 TRINITY_DN8472_c0_g1_i1:199-510(-)